MGEGLRKLGRDGGTEVGVNAELQARIREREIFERLAQISRVSTWYGERLWP